jgi:hypothetical protein
MYGPHMDFAGSVGQYVGRKLLLWQNDGEYDLRFEDDLVGRLTRPSEAYLAETRDGSWELWHKRRTDPRIRVTDASTGTEVANYKKRAFRSGGKIVTPEQTYHLRPQHLIDSSGTELLTMVYDDEVSGRMAMTPVGDSDELGLLAMLCCYISLLENVPVPMSSTGEPEGA